VKALKKENTMSIEQNLERIATALEIIAIAARATATDKLVNAGTTDELKLALTPTPKGPAALEKPTPTVATTTAPAPAKETRTGKASAKAGNASVEIGGETAPTVDNVMDSLRELVQVKGAPVAKGVLAEFGATKISDIAVQDYAAVDKRLKAEKGA